VIDRAPLDNVGPLPILRPRPVADTGHCAKRSPRAALLRMATFAASAIAAALLLFAGDASAQGPSMRKLTLPLATLGTSYSYNTAQDWFCGSNSSPVFSFLWQNPGAVPGLALPSNGAISGTPALAGTYTLTVTVTDISGRTGACSGTTTTTYTLQVLAAAPACSISRTPSGAVNAGTQVVLTATCSNTPSTIEWSANGVVIGSTQTISVKPEQTTTYTVVASNTVGTGAQSTLVSVIPAAPACTISASPPGALPKGSSVTLNATCEPAATSYSWKTFSFVVGTGSSLTYPIQQDSQFVLTATGPGGASTATITIAARIGAPSRCKLTATPAALPPGGGNVQLTASCAEGGEANALGYSWTGTGTAGKNTASISIAVASTTTFTVRASNASGQSEQVSATVSVGVAPPSACTIVPFPASLPPGGGAVKLTATCNDGGTPSDTGYRWTGLANYGGTLGPTTPTVTANISSSQTFFVQVLNDAGAASVAQVTVPVVPAPPPPNYQGIWWNAPAFSEAGWGVNLAHQGDVIFATWFTYDVDNTPLWFAAVLNRVGPLAYSGELIRVVGPGFLEVPWNKDVVNESTAGTASLNFADNNNATFVYTVGNVQRVKPITRQLFAEPVPACAWGAQPNLAAVTNYQDLWWASPAGSESGWGININHQGATLFATWYTYDVNRVPLWLVMVATRVAPKIYRGTIYSSTGPSYASVPFNQAIVREREIGSVTFTFDDGNNGSFEYTVLGLAGTKRITRQNFAAAGTATVCTPTEVITTCNVSMTTGFRGDPNAVYKDGGNTGSGGNSASGGGGSDGSSGSDGGSAGAGVGEGKVLGGLLTLSRLSDGAALGSAITDATTGMVTISACEADLPALITISGLPGAKYYDEGTNQLSDFGTGKVLHALVDQLDENIGVSAMTEAAYRYALQNFAAGGQSVDGRPLKAAGVAGLTLGQVRAANATVLREVNRTLGSDIQLATIKALPTPVDNGSPTSAFPNNRYGLAAAVTGGFAKAAAFHLPTSSTPALAWTEQFARDLTDGKLNGFAADGTPAAAGSAIAYDPVRFPIALGTGIYSVSQRFGATTTFQLGSGLADVKTFTLASGECIQQSDLIGLLNDGTVNVLRTTPKPGLTCYTTAADSVSTLLRNFGSGVKQIATTASNAYMMKIDGNVFTWGRGNCGLLGNGTDTVPSTSPVQVSNLANVTSLVNVGFYTVIARDRRGFVFAWGSNQDGLLGGVVTDSTNTACVFPPDPFLIEFVGIARTPKRITSLSNIVSVAAGTGNQAIAVDDQGRVYAWGALNAGGADQTTPKLIPGTSGVISVTSGSAGVYALKANGTVSLLNYSGGLQPIAGLTDVVEMAGAFALRRDGTIRDLNSGYDVGAGFTGIVIGGGPPPPPVTLPKFRHVARKPLGQGLVIDALAVDDSVVNILAGVPPSGCGGGKVCVTGGDIGAPPSVTGVATGGLK
jgi:hypothetical protein